MSEEDVPVRGVNWQSTESLEAGGLGAQPPAADEALILKMCDLMKFTISSYSQLSIGVWYHICITITDS